MRRALTVAMLVVALAGVDRVHAQNASADTRQLDAFLAQLQRALAAEDRSAVAAVVRYPIIISIGGFRVPFATAASVIDRYDDIFNPPLREAIARGAAEILASKDLVVEAVNGQLRITSIRVPHFEESATAAPSTPAAASRGGVRPQQPFDGAQRKPRRVAIRVGPRPTQIPGLLARDATDTLILYLPKGKLASVRLERVPAGAAVIRVVHASTGAPLAARPSADGRFVSGRPAESADYRIEVRRIDKTDAAHLPYMLSLSLR